MVRKMKMSYLTTKIKTKWDSSIDLGPDVFSEKLRKDERGSVFLFIQLPNQRLRHDSG